MYEVLTDDGFTVMETDSFCEAVKYARHNGFTVYSTDLQRVIYDGMGDELIVEA